MIKTRPVRGIVPVVDTPLTANEDIDVPGLKRLIEFLNTKNIGGLWVLGTGSEDMNLSFAKRLKAAQAACEANAGKAPLILGAGFFALEDIFNFIDETKQLEFDAYHVMPYNPKLSLDRVDWFYRHIADNCPKPLWMYVSGNWSRSVTPEFVANLKPHPNIAGFKFSNSNTVSVTKVAGMADDQFQVITAVASQLHACLCMGSKGHTSSLSCCIPEPMIEIYELFLEKRIEESLAAQHRLNAFLDELSKNTKTDNFLWAADEKYILKLRGICHEYVTSYYRQISTVEKERVRKLLDQYRFF
ncbi:MAG: dihydrodipicolinate synthase family protein [Desulfobacterales bacterium]|jgi:4-hydroxy-tetrahydrodipicolinate synthase